MGAKIRWTCRDPYPPGVATGNQSRNSRLDLPEVGSIGPVSRKLAVVGSAPSVATRLHLLRNWDGEVWSINAAWRWLKQRGIDSTFYTVDPAPIMAEWCRGATRAVLTDTVDPAVFAVLRDAHVEIARIGPGGMPNDCSSASTAPMVAAARGHKHITFFGCDSSFSNKSHVDRHEASQMVRVLVGDKAFMTNPGLLLIAEAIAGFAKEFPTGIAVEGDGFLSALINHGDYEVTHISRALAQQIEWK